MVTVSDFESRAITLGDSAIVESMQRKLFLKEATSFKDASRFMGELSLIKFYTQADDFFSFFQEISAEGVNIHDLYAADSYAEFGQDLDVLDRVLTNYRDILRHKNLTDKLFAPMQYELNDAYIESYDGFYMELEGYLTQFEIELFLKIAALKPFTIKVRTTPFNLKVINIFRELGIEIAQNSIVEFSLSEKRVLSAENLPLNVQSEVIECAERIEQIAVAVAKIEEMVKSGIDADKIALIVPDESIVPLLRSFDRAKNFNFAMGQSFREDISYKFLEQLHSFLRGDTIAKEFLQHNNFDFSVAVPIELIGVEEFFTQLKLLNIPRFNSETLLEELEKVKLLERYYRFVHIFKSRELHFKEWLFIWLHELAEHSIDDTRGGKVTVMGVLESRGIRFDGVVVLDFNDDKAPSVSNKDRFLNSSIRAAAKLPTKTDRENLQKHYYARLLEKAKSSVLIYSSSDNAQPSKFLYELGVAGSIKRYKSPHQLLFDKKSNYDAYKHMDDIKFAFDARATVWSASKLKIFLECKRKFYYRYIKGLQEAPDSELNDGAILHTLLYRVINPQCSYSESSELKKALLQEMAKIESADNRVPYKRLLWDKMLDGFVGKQIEHFRSGWQVANCEFEASGTIAGLEFKGRIDRMDSKDGQSLIIDYKSGSIQGANSSKVENMADFQMSIYAKLLDRPVDNIDFAFVEILNGGKLTYLQSPQEKEEKLLEHIEYLKSQKSLRAERCDDLQKCRYCPYTLLCHRGEYL